MAPTRLRAPSYSPLQSVSLRASPKAPAPAEGIESALFAHFICSARAFETAVLNDPHSGAADDIISALNTLRSTVNDQKQQNETLQGSRSFLQALPSGLSLRDLPIPPMDKTMACIRITQGASLFSRYMSLVLTSILQTARRARFTGRSNLDLWGTSLST